MANTELKSRKQTETERLRKVRWDVTVLGEHVVKMASGGAPIYAGPAQGYWQ